MGWISKIGNAVKKGFRTGRRVIGAAAPIASMIPGYGPILGAGFKALGDTSGDSAQSNQRKRNDFEYARSLADQYAFQDDSVQRRVADARAAGIHPLAALGFQAPSFIPPQPSQDYYTQGETDPLFQMGQDIGRAITAAQTQDERAKTAAAMSPYDVAILRRTELENRGLELDLLYKMSRLVRMREGVGPSFPDGKTSQPDFPNSVTGIEPGHVPAITNMRNTDGTDTIVPSSQAKPLIEDMLPLELEWYWKNRIVPLVNPYAERIIRHIEKRHGRYTYDFGSDSHIKPRRRRSIRPRKARAASTMRQPNYH